MLKWIYLSCLLIGSLNVIDAKDSQRIIEGVYYSPEIGLEIYVEYNRNNLHVKGLPNTRGWQKFNRTNLKTWYSRNGSKIKIGRRSQLIFHQNRYGNHRSRMDIIHFYKYKPRFYRNQRNRSYYQNKYGEFRDRTNNHFTGQWYSNDFKLYMYVEKTARGIRTRLENDGNWTNYSSRDNGTYWEDKKGNTIRFSERNTLLWTSKNGRRVLELTR